MSLVQQGSLSTYLVLTSSCDGASQSLDDEASLWYLLAHIFTWCLLKVIAWQLHQPRVWQGQVCCPTASMSEELLKELKKVNKFYSVL